MVRRRTQRAKEAHYCLLVNRKAADYRPRPVEQLVAAIKAGGGRYTVLEPESAMQMLKWSNQVAGGKRSTEGPLAVLARRGKVTALVACGGDGTVNLVSRGAASADLPLGILPMGRFNNIARSLCLPGTCEVAAKKILAGQYRKIDVGTAADQVFLGSIGFGFVPELAEMLADRKTPRFGIGWSQLAAKAAAGVKLSKMVIKIDAFRFEISPLILHITLLSHAVGLPFSPSFIDDDGRAEVILDRGDAAGEFSGYVRALARNKYSYGTNICLYRGEEITLQPTRGRTMYLDGELLELPTQSLAVRINQKKLKVFC